MIARIGNKYIDLNSIIFAGISEVNGFKSLSVVLETKTTNLDLTFLDNDAEYLENLLDAKHYVTVSKLRDVTKVNDQ